MNMFATFKERAQASMRDAMSTATELASSAMDNVKVRAVLSQLQSVAVRPIHI